jgi:hypothetical protein
MNRWSDDETDNPLIADDRNYYKVEKWTKDGSKVDRMLYAGNNLERARDILPAPSGTGHGSGSRSGSGRGCCSSGLYSLSGAAQEVLRRLLSLPPTIRLRHRSSQRHLLSGDRYA